jgi:hypothetical protein
MNETKSKLAFSRINYILMMAGIGILSIGFIIMTMDKETYGFGFLGLTLGPILVMAGFIFEIFAILYRQKRN